MCSLISIYVFFRLFVNSIWIVIYLCVLSGDWFIHLQLTGPKLNRLKGQTVKIGETVIYCASPRFLHLVRQLPSVIGLPEGSLLCVSYAASFGRQRVTKLLIFRVGKLHTNINETFYRADFWRLCEAENLFILWWNSRSNFKFVRKSPWPWLCKYCSLMVCN
jgi:hypothetical protein